MSSIDTITKIMPLQYGNLPSPCPCCGHELTSTVNTIGFDYWKGRVFKDGVQVLLEPMEADLLKILLDNWPKICSREKLLVGLYGGNYFERVSSDNIGVLLSKLRIKIKIFDIKIENANRRGWWLIKKTTELHLDLRNKEPALEAPAGNGD